MSDRRSPVALRNEKAIIPSVPVPTMRQRLASECGRKALKADRRCSRAINLYENPDINQLGIIKVHRYQVDKNLRAYRRHEAKARAA